MAILPLMAAIANLCAKEKEDAFAKQMIAFAAGINKSIERVFLVRPKAAKLCTILSLLFVVQQCALYIISKRNKSKNIHF